jgi:transcriptional regulator with XRE-family HTH domain
MKQLRKSSFEIRKVLADNIRRYRHEKRLSQEKLAEACGLHRTYIGSVERGERNVTLSTLEVLSKALCTTVPKLLLRETAKSVKGVSRHG